MHYDGVRWATMSKPRTGLVGFVVRMWGNAPTNIWVGGLWTDRFDSTAFLRFDGTQWRSTMVPRGYTAIWSSGGSTAWAAGNSTFAVFDGSAWAAATSGTGTVYDMWGSAASDVWAVGADGIWRYSGTNWSSVTSAACATGGCTTFTSVWGASATDVWVVGNRSALHYDAGRWSSVPPEQVQSMWPRSVWGSGPDDVWVASGTGSTGPGIGAMYHYDGMSWSRYSTPPDLPNLLGVWGSSAYDIWAVGDDGTLLHGTRPR